MIVEDENDNNNTQSSTEQQQQQLSQSPFSQQLQSQQEERPPQSQQRSPGTSVSIPSGSSSLTDTAFQPNPVQVSVADTVTWTNDDLQPHTVTSGENGAPDGKFDSSPNFNPLLNPGQTFSHTFTIA